MDVLELGRTTTLLLLLLRFMINRHLRRCITASHSLYSPTFSILFISRWSGGSQRFISAHFFLTYHMLHLPNNNPPFNTLLYSAPLLSVPAFHRQRQTSHPPHTHTHTRPTPFTSGATLPVIINQPAPNKLLLFPWGRTSQQLCVCVCVRVFESQ